MSHHRLAIFCATFLVLAATACGPQASPPPPTTDTTITDTPTTDTPTTDTPTTDTPTTDTPTTDSPASSEAIWQWSIGKNVWTDADLQKYTQDLGSTDDTEVFVYSEGFSLTMDDSGTVVSVTLYNDEIALGIPQSETSFSAYQGRLPMGLTWSSTANDLGAVSGNQSSGGFGSGLEYTFDYPAKDGYRLAITFNANHEADLPDALIHTIGVRRP